MGGNAIKNASRMNRNVYFSLSRLLVQTIEDAMPSTSISVPESYYSKRDFGDLDILISKPFSADILKHLRMEVVEISTNGPTTSLGIKGSYGNIYQVDLQYIPETNFDFARQFYKFNDLNAFIGIIARRMGFKFKDSGLCINYLQKSGKSSEILVTKDFEQALTFLGFDFNEFKNGFETLEDIFNFVIGSKYYNSSIFQPFSLTNDRRHRMKKRSNYVAFLEYIDGSQGGFEFPDDKSGWLYLAASMFPEFRKEYERIKLEDIDTEILKTKFNGNLVKEWTGFTGKDLGEEIQYFIKSFGEYSLFKQFILNNSVEVIKQRFKENMGK